MTGTTVRNVRSHQSRGLLPPPEIRARTGYYGPEHVARVRMIQAMQAEGFRLKAIERLLDRPEDAAEQIFNFGHSLLHAFGLTHAEFATTDELAERFGGALDPRLLRKAEKLGLIRSLGEERWEIRNPTLVSAGEQLVAWGSRSPTRSRWPRRSSATRRRSPRLTCGCSAPTCSGGKEIAERSAEEWAQVQEALERLRPLAMEAITRELRARHGRADREPAPQGDG